MKRRNTLRKQKIMGVILLLVSIAIIVSGDATGAVFTLPLSLYLLLSKEIFIFED